MKTKILFAIVLFFTNAGTALALAPEPETILYGAVYNHYKGANLMLTNGRMIWIVKARNGDQASHIYTTDLEPLAGGRYSYCLAIPQRAAGDLAALPALDIGSLETNENTIFLVPESDQYDHLSITIDGAEAQIQAPANAFIRLGQDLRSQHLRVDLTISRPPDDGDSDGIPNLWEDENGLDADNPGDAAADPDGDGLTNLAEFNLASDPNNDNRVPSLQSDTLLLYEQGVVQFRPLAIDSDTPANALWIVLEDIPAEIVLTAFGTDSPAQIQPGDRIRFLDILEGKIRMTHAPESVDPWAPPQPPGDMKISLDDGVHPPMAATLRFEMFQPSASNGSGAQFWMDAMAKTDKPEEYLQWLQDNDGADLGPISGDMVLFGRSGNRLSDFAVCRSKDGRASVTIQTTGNRLPSGKSAINLPGDRFLEYMDSADSEPPFDLNGDLSLFAVIKAAGEGDQTVAATNVSELGITGIHNAGYARRLRFAPQETRAIYSAMPIDANWGIAGLFQNNGSLRMEWNGDYIGGLNEQHELTRLSASHAVGGKTLGSAASQDYRSTNLMSGGVGEMLIFKKPLQHQKKWRIYAYLLGKWFDFIVLDGTDQTTDARLMAASAAATRINQEIIDAMGDPVIADQHVYYHELLLEFGDQAPDQSAQYEAFKALYGPDARCAIIGGPANDELIGGWEDDLLVAGEGQDQLIGLGGADHFVPQDGTMIVDFNAAQGDVIDLSHLLQPSGDQPLDNYLRLVADNAVTRIHIDADGGEGGLNRNEDAVVTLANISLRNYDLGRLWADGGLITGGPRPPIQMGLSMTAQSADEWTEIDGEPFRIFLTGIMPNGMLLPLDLRGKAEAGVDYHLGIDYYDPETGKTRIYETNGNALPLSLPQGMETPNPPKIYVFPHKDGVTELPEILSIVLRDVPDYYDIDPDNHQVDLMLSDGDDRITIETTIDTAREPGEVAGQITVRRDGSLDRDLAVKLVIQGTAELGEDYLYIPSEITIPAGETEVTIPIQPIADSNGERDEFVEIFVVDEEGIEVIGASSARVMLTETPAEKDLEDDTTPALPYPVTDTEQTACYDTEGAVIDCAAATPPLQGQDAGYAGFALDYTDNGNGTITDNVTGLMWQQYPGAKMTYTQAVADAFELAGHADWRLPTIKELYSLIRFSGVDPSGYKGTDVSSLIPFIDTDYFHFQYGDPAAGERLIDAQFLSATLYANSTETVFGVNFADGRIKAYPTENKTFFVLHVRNGGDYGVNIFANNGDGTISDNAAGLMWTQSDSGNGLTWTDALGYCEDMETAGHSDWRLPNAKELQSIIDYARSPNATASPAIDPAFETTAIVNEAGQTDYPYYWTSTTHANWTETPGKNAAYIAFGRAMGYMNGEWTDVHGSGAQRSDPKIGNPADYPQGHGPQGDAIRIYNFARCVRDIDAKPDDGDDDSPAGPTLDDGDGGGGGGCFIKVARW